jgi:hypothetical protein
LPSLLAIACDRLRPRRWLATLAIACHHHHDGHMGMRSHDGLRSLLAIACDRLRRTRDVLSLPFLLADILSSSMSSIRVVSVSVVSVLLLTHPGCSIGYSPVPSFPVLSLPLLFYFVLSYSILSSPILSSPLLSSPLLSCPLLSSLVPLLSHLSPKPEFPC